MKQAGCVGKCCTRWLEKGLIAHRRMPPALYQHQLIASMREYRPSVPRASGFSKEASNLDFYEKSLSF